MGYWGGPGSGRGVSVLSRLRDWNLRNAKGAGQVLDSMEEVAKWEDAGCKGQLTILPPIKSRIDHGVEGLGS